MKCYGCEKETNNPQYCSKKCYRERYERARGEKQYYCGVCNILKTTENSWTNKRGKFNTYCDACVRDLQIVKHRIFKSLCVKYKGGKCERCGYNQCEASLQFHHKNKESKEFGISSRCLFTEEVRLELDKCELLCSNCHFESHFIEKQLNPLVVNYTLSWWP